MGVQELQWLPVCVCVCVYIRGCATPAYQAVGSRVRGASNFFPAWMLQNNAGLLQRGGSRCLAQKNLEMGVGPAIQLKAYECVQPSGPANHGNCASNKVQSLLLVSRDFSPPGCVAVVCCGSSRVRHSPGSAAGRSPRSCLQWPYTPDSWVHFSPLMIRSPLSLKIMIPSHISSATVDTA